MVERREGYKPRRPKEKRLTNRVQLGFSEAGIAELNKAQKQMNASSRAEVMRTALKRLNWVVNHEKAGDTILIERKDGSQAEVEFGLTRYPPIEDSGK